MCGSKRYPGILPSRRCSGVRRPLASDELLLKGEKKRRRRKNQNHTKMWKLIKAPPPPFVVKDKRRHKDGEHRRQVQAPDFSISNWARLRDQRGSNVHAHAPVLILFRGLFLEPTHVNVAVQMLWHTQGAPLPVAHLNKSLSRRRIYSTITQRIITYS